MQQVNAKLRQRQMPGADQIHQESPVLMIPPFPRCQEFFRLLLRYRAFHIGIGDNAAVRSILCGSIHFLPAGIFSGISACNRIPGNACRRGNMVDSSCQVCSLLRCTPGTGKHQCGKTDRQCISFHKNDLPFLC